jgi:hypothetical protein
LRTKIRVGTDQFMAKGKQSGQKMDMISFCIFLEQCNSKISQHF